MNRTGFLVAVARPAPSLGSPTAGGATTGVQLGLGHAGADSARVDQLAFRCVVAEPASPRRAARFFDGFNQPAALSEMKELPWLWHGEQRHRL